MIISLRHYPSIDSINFAKLLSQCLPQGENGKKSYLCCNGKEYKVIPVSHRLEFKNEEFKPLPYKVILFYANKFQRELKKEACLANPVSRTLKWMDKCHLKKLSRRSPLYQAIQKICECVKNIFFFGQLQTNHALALKLYKNLELVDKKSEKEKEREEPRNAPEENLKHPKPVIDHEENKSEEPEPIHRPEPKNGPESGKRDESTVPPSVPGHLQTTETVKPLKPEGVPSLPLLPSLDKSDEVKPITEPALINRETIPLDEELEWMCYTGEERNKKIQAYKDEVLEHNIQAICKVGQLRLLNKENEFALKAFKHAVQLNSTGVIEYIRALEAKRNFFTNRGRAMALKVTHETLEETQKMNTLSMNFSALVGQIKGTLLTVFETQQKPWPEDLIWS